MGESKEISFLYRFKKKVTTFMKKTVELFGGLRKKLYLCTRKKK